MREGHIEDYEGLKANVLRFLHRPDLTDVVGDFIALGELRMNRELKIRGTLTQKHYLVSAGRHNISLPSDYLAYVRAWRGRPFLPDNEIDHGLPVWEDLEHVRWDDLKGTWADPYADTSGSHTQVHLDPAKQIEFVDPERFLLEASRGSPRYCTINGQHLILDRSLASTSDITLQYVRKLQLSSDQPKNYVLREYPDVYLYASLLETPLWTHKKGWLAVWQDRYDRAILGINRVESQSSAHQIRRSDELIQLLK
ncbi:MAG: hypothetical protein LC541_14875 [Candidatus Thiodiazotropha sp.]|nr:hypothetical protein [Candidatus Thiodiazotropha sp.]MCM8884553.1 hypothetical protein [Candidatus Thiodiazotropha sp.]